MGIRLSGKRMGCGQIFVSMRVRRTGGERIINSSEVIIDWANEIHNNKNERGDHFFLGKSSKAEREVG